MLDKLIDAIRNESVEKVKEFLAMGIEPNKCEDEDKITPLHFAAQRDSISASQIVQLLLVAGANPLAKNYPGEETPIDIAIGVECLNTARVLEKWIENQPES